MPSRRRLLLAGCLPLLGCSGFNPLVIPDAAVDASVTPDLALDSGSVVDTLAPDGGPPQAPPDHACTAAWTEDQRPPECQARRVLVIDGDVIAPKGVSLARTPAGRIAVAYASFSTPDEAQLRVARFTEGTSSIGTVTFAKLGNAFERAGVASAIASGADETIHLAYLNSSDWGNEIRYAQLPSQSAPSPSETLASGHSATGHVDLAVTSSDVFVAHYNDTSGALRVQRRPLTGPSQWSAPQKIADAVAVSPSPQGTGQLEMLTTDDHPQLAYHHGAGKFTTQPRYTVFDGTLWAASKTLDNALLDGEAGWSVGLASFGVQRYAAFFARGTTSAALRLVSWVSDDDTPTIEVVDQGVPDGSNPLFRVAIATDPAGLVHLAILRPNALIQGGKLEYRRQVRVAGQLKWLTDFVDDDALGSDSGPIDILVDDSFRPHIAYFSAAAIHYATRFDR